MAEPQPGRGLRGAAAAGLLGAAGGGGGGLPWMYICNQM